MAQTPASRLGDYLPDPSWESGTLIHDLRSTLNGGKCVRSTLFNAAYRALGGGDVPVQNRMSVVLESLHEAFLLHDDLADNDFFRRGALNVAGRTVARSARNGMGIDNARHMGSVAEMLAGDAVLTVALIELASLECAMERRQQVINEVERTVLITIHGEYEDVHQGLSQRTPDVQTSLKIARAKTAEYSMVLPLVTAGILSGAHAGVVDALRTAGAHMGLAYQLADDLLGVFGDPIKTGKSADSDMQQRPPTFLFADAATRPEWPEIARALSEDRERARMLLTKCGSRDRTRALAVAEAESAHRILTEPPIPSAVADALKPFVPTFAERNR